MTRAHHHQELARLNQLGLHGQREEVADRVHHLTALLEAFFRLGAGSEGNLIDDVLPARQRDRETRIAILYGLLDVAEQARLGAEALATDFAVERQMHEDGELEVTAP